jgi:hypothetical protein
MVPSPLKCASGALVLALTGLAGCSDDPNARVRGEFLSSCLRGGAPKWACTCAFERLEKRFTPEELQQLLTPTLNALSVQPELSQRLVQETARAAVACSNQ